MVFCFRLVTFALMNKKYSIISLSFAVMVLLALLLQSVHSIHHLEKALSEKHCHHKYAKNKTEVSHHHSDSDHCFVCEFALGNYTKTISFTYNFKKIEIPVSYSFFYSKEITQSFRGSLFALRAPPYFIA